MPLKIGCFIATSTPSSLPLSSMWIWDSANSRHICHNCLAFHIFSFLTNKPPITGLGESMWPERESEVRLIYKTFDGQTQVLFLNNIQYMSKAFINLILQRQIHQEGLHRREIAILSIWVKTNIFTQLVDNNVYLMDIFSLEPLGMVIIK